MLFTLLVLLKAFFWGFLLSFLGSIPPGMINLRVWHLSITGRRSDALQITLGATLVEMIYAAVALQLNRAAYKVSVLYPYLYFFVAVCMGFFAYRVYFFVQRAEKPQFSPIKEGFFHGCSESAPDTFLYSCYFVLTGAGSVLFERFRSVDELSDGYRRGGGFFFDFCCVT